MAKTPPNGTAGGPWSQRGFVAAAAFLGIVIVVAVGILLIKPGDSSDSSGGTSPANGNGGKPAARKDPAASACGLAAGSQDVPQTPPEAQWELIGKIAAPKSEAIGPGIAEGKRRLCFAHSPTGALFAAVNFVAVAARDPNNTDVLRELTAAGRARDESLRANANSSDEGSQGGGLQVAAFRMSDYGGNETTVDLAFAVQAKGFVRLPLPLRWERGDWKVVVTTAEGPFANYEALANLSGYVPWSGT
jgi:hypothetical protein